MVNFVFITDLHLGGGLNLYPEDERQTIQLAAFANGLKTAKVQRDDVLVFSGDTFDTPYVSGKLLLAFAKMLSKLPNEMVFMSGNHDMESVSKDQDVQGLAANALDYIEAMALMTDRITVVKSPQVIAFENDGSCDVEFLPWPHTEATSDAALVVAHKEFRGASYDSGRLAAEEASVFDIASAKKLDQKWVSGHLHTGHDLYNGILTYPGSLYTTKPLPLIDGKLRSHQILVASVETGSVSYNFYPIEFAYHMVSASLERDDIDTLVSIMHKSKVRMLLDTKNQALPEKLVKYGDRIRIGRARKNAVSEIAPVVPLTATTVYNDGKIRSMVFRRVCSSLKTGAERMRLRKIMREEINS